MIGNGMNNLMIVKDDKLRSNNMSENMTYIDSNDGEMGQTSVISNVVNQSLLPINEKIEFDVNTLTNLGEEFGKIKYLSNETNLDFPEIGKCSIDENKPYSSFASIGEVLKEKIDLSNVWEELNGLGEEVARYKWAYDQGKFGDFDGKKVAKEVGKSVLRSGAVGSLNTFGNVFKMFGHNLKKENIMTDAINMSSVVNGAGDILIKLGDLMNEYAINVNDLPIWAPSYEVYDENPNWMSLANLVGQSAAQVLAMSALSKSIGSAATYGLFASAGSAEIFNESMDKDSNVDKANLLALSNASLTYSIDKIFNPLPKQLEKGVKRTSQMIAKELVGAPLREVGSEVLQQIGAENLVRKIGIDDTQKLFEGVIESAIGAMAGSFVVTGGDGSIYYARKSYEDVVKAIKSKTNINNETIDLFEKNIIDFAMKSPEAFNKVFERNLEKNISTFVKSIDDAKKRKEAKKDLAQLPDVYSEMKHRVFNATGDEKISNMVAKLFEANALFLYQNDQKFTPETLIEMHLPEIKKSDKDEALKLLSSPQRAVAFQFGGVKAKNIDINGLLTAIDMEKRKIDPQIIWKNTGWHRGSDGKMRFEIDDEKAKLKLWDNVDREMDVNIYKNELIHDLELMAMQYAYLLRPYNKKNYESYYNDFYKFLEANDYRFVQFDRDKFIDLGISQGEDFSLIDDMVQKRRDFEELYMAELWNKYQKAIDPNAKENDKDAVFVGEDAKTIDALIEEKNFAHFYKLYWSNGKNGLKKVVDEVEEINLDEEKYKAREQRLIDIALRYQKEREKRAESIKKYGLENPYYLYHDIRANESFDIYMANKGDLRDNRGTRGYRSGHYREAYEPQTLGEEFLAQPQYDFMDEMHKIDLIKYLDQVEIFYRLERYLKFVKEDNARSVKNHNNKYLDKLKYSIEHPVLLYKSKIDNDSVLWYRNFEKDEIASYQGRLLVQNGNKLLLGEVLDHPQLYEMYPELKDVVIEFTRLRDDEPYHFYVEDNNKYVFQIDAEQVDYGSFTDLLLKGTNFAIEHEEGFDYSLTDKQRANFMDRQIYMAKKKIESAALNELWVFVERVLGTSDYKKYWKKTEMPVSLLNIYKGLEVNQNEDVETIQFGEIDFDLLLKDINQKYSNIENDDDNYIRRTMLWQLQGLKSGYMRKILAEARMNTGLIDVGMPWSGYFTQGKASELALVKHREHNNYLSRNPYFSDSKGYVQILSDQGVGVLDAISYDDDTEMKFKKDEELIKHVWASVANGAYDFSDNVIHLFENADVETIIHESFHYFNNFLKNPQFRNNFVLEGDYYDVLDGIKEDISLKYKVLKSDGRFFVVNKETGEIMPEVQRAFNSADEAIDTAAEEVFVSRMVKLFYGKRTLGRDIASAANLYRTWLNKLTAGIGVTSKTSGEGGKEVLKFFRNKIK